MLLCLVLLFSSSSSACLKATYDLMSRAESCPLAGYTPPCLSCMCKQNITQVKACLAYSWLWCSQLMSEFFAARFIALVMRLRNSPVIRVFATVILPFLSVNFVRWAGMESCALLLWMDAVTTKRKFFAYMFSNRIYQESIRLLASIQTNL